MKDGNSSYPTFGIQQMNRSCARFYGYIRSGFLRLSIAHKLIMGFMSVVLLVFIISIFTLFSLNRLDTLTTRILKTDVMIIDSIEKMVDAILAQDLYAQRYLILKNPGVLELFWEKDKEFQKLTHGIQTIPEKRSRSMEPIVSLHQSYRDAMVQRFTYQESPDSSDENPMDKAIREKLDKLMAAIQSVKAETIKDQRAKTEETSAITKRAFQISIMLCALSLMMSIGISMLITRNIAGAVNQLEIATHRIAKGEFDYHPKIQSSDELGALSTAFVQMAQRLKQLEEMNLDASPLTRLPGGVTIEKNLQQRIQAEKQIAFCLIDINHFKVYNDSYGYVKGNDLIRTTADIINGVVAEFGTADDFIGHIGGDDFVVITDPESFKKICDTIITRFDQVIPGFYDAETREQKFLVCHNRQGQKVTFPLASLSIAVVTNSKRSVTNHIEYGEIAAELKKYAKSKPGSNWVVDRRYNPANLDPNIHKTSTGSVGGPKEGTHDRSCDME